MGNVMMEASQINYRGGETKMSVEQALKETSGEAAAIAALQEAVGNLQTTKANLITIAPVFSAEASYEAGDLVYYNGLTYRCTNDHTGEWDADDFAATTIANELSALKSGLTNALGNVKFAVLDIPNDKTSATLTLTITAQNVIFLSPFPCSAKDGYEELTVDLNSGVVTITKPSASYGGTDQHFYLLCAYV